MLPGGSSKLEGYNLSSVLVFERRKGYEDARSKKKVLSSVSSYCLFFAVPKKLQHLQHLHQTTRQQNRHDSGCGAQEEARPFHLELHLERRPSFQGPCQAGPHLSSFWVVFVFFSRDVMIGTCAVFFFLIRYIFLNQIVWSFFVNSCQVCHRNLAFEHGHCDPDMGKT